MLRFVSHTRAINRKPVIVLYGWPRDQFFAKEAIDYGASFAFQAPFKPQNFVEAIDNVTE